MINIRQAHEDDWPLIEKLNTLYNYENPASFILESIENQQVLIAEVNQQATGYLLWQKLWGNTPFLALVKVLPEFQRSKHGTTLVKAFEDEMRKAGFTYYVSSTIENNHEAKAFHQALNYQKAGAIDMHYGAEIFYSKQL